jgi:hypothetical protein
LGNAKSKRIPHASCETKYYLTDKLRKLEARYKRKFKDISAAIQFLLQKDQLATDQQERKRIGFKTETKK